MVPVEPSEWGTWCDTKMQCSLSCARPGQALSVGDVQDFIMSFISGARKRPREFQERKMPQGNWLSLAVCRRLTEQWMKKAHLKWSIGDGTGWGVGVGMVWVGVVWAWQGYGGGRGGVGVGWGYLKKMDRDAECENRRSRCWCVRSSRSYFGFALWNQAQQELPCLLRENQRWMCFPTLKRSLDTHEGRVRL